MSGGSAIASIASGTSDQRPSSLFQFLPGSTLPSLYPPRRSPAAVRHVSDHHRPTGVRNAHLSSRVADQHDVFVRCKDCRSGTVIAVVPSDHQCGPNNSSNRSPNHASNTSSSASVIGTRSGQSSMTIHVSTSCLGGRPMRGQGSVGMQRSRARCPGWRVVGTSRQDRPTRLRDERPISIPQHPSSSRPVSRRRWMAVSTLI